MAIESVAETALGRDSYTGQLGRRTYVRNFIVITTTPYAGELQVKTAVDPVTGVAIPRPYEPYRFSHEVDLGAIVRSVRAKQRDNSRLVWDVSAEYDSEFEPFENPFTEPPEIRYETEIYDQPLPGRAATFYDPNSQAPPQSEDPTIAGDGQFLSGWGQGFTTSAGEPFDPPPTMPRARPIVKFTRNQPVFRLADKVKYENSVNKKAWCGLQPRQAWMRSILAGNHVHKSTTVGVADIYYARVEYTIAIKAETWDLLLLDIGSYYLDYSSGSPIRKAFTVEATGEKRLGLLDHRTQATLGSKLAAGQDAQFLRWRVFREEDFDPLQIDLNLLLEHIRTRRRKA